MVSLDSKFLFLIGGSLDPYFLGEFESIPEYSILLIDIESRKVLHKGKMMHFRSNPAVALFEKEKIFIAGG